MANDLLSNHNNRSAIDARLVSDGTIAIDRLSTYKNNELVDFSFDPFRDQMDKKYESESREEENPRLISEALRLQIFLLLRTMYDHSFTFV
jgi:hypothetical protein